MDSQTRLPRATLPALEHLGPSDYERVYEPADDTFLLLDVLTADAAWLAARQPLLCAEVGSGSGAVISGLGALLNRPSAALSHAEPVALLATDINRDAAVATAKTASANALSIDAVHSDLLSAFRGSCIDVLIFNPPYVPTSETELDEAASSGGISASWAGGPRGRLVLDRLLPCVGRMLSARGVFYLLGVHENDPEELMRALSRIGMQARVVARRRAQNERLFVIRAERLLGEAKHAGDGAAGGGGSGGGGAGGGGGGGGGGGSGDEGGGDFRG